MNNFGDPAMTTTTKTTVTETHVQTNLRWDPSYIKTIPGGLKLGAVVSHQKISFRAVKFRIFQIFKPFGIQGNVNIKSVISDIHE